MIEDTFIKNDTDIQVGSNIKKIRTVKGMKPSELVREVNLLGVSVNVFSLSKIEANKQHIRASQLKAIRQILKCSYEELFDGESNEKAQEKRK